jgi:hypothetical protein
MESNSKRIRLERLERRRDKIKSLLNSKDELLESFHGGRVGFKAGAAKRKHENKIEKEMALYKEFQEIETKIDRLKNPLVRSKAKQVDPTTLRIGDIKYHLGCKVKVIKINKKTVTVQYCNSDFKEAIKPHLLD